MDIAVVVGHHPDAPGATLSLGNQTVSEYDLWLPLGRELTRSLTCEGVDATLIERPNPEPDSDLAHRVNHTGASAAIELHFNAGGGQGSEMLHWPGSRGGKRLASILQERVVKTLETNDRGARAHDDLAFLEMTTMPAVICEPAFGDDPQDAFTLVTRLPNLMQAYREALIDWLK